MHSNIAESTNITWFITFTFTITRIPSISFIAYTCINQFFTFASTFIIIQTLFIIKNTCIQSTCTLTRFMPFYVYPLSHASLSINSLHSHHDLSSFKRCLLLQTLASNLHVPLHVSCHFICLGSLVLDIRLNTLKLISAIFHYF